MIRGRTAPATPDLPVQSIPGTRISGVLRDGASAALPRAALTLVDPNGRQIARGTARGDGSYELTVPAPGSYVLIAAADGHQPQAVPVAVDGHTLSRDLTLAALRPGARIRGTVRAASSGRPLADARVTLVDAEGEAVATRTTGPDGSYGFTGLAAGEYTVIARGYSPVSTAVTLDGMGESGFDLLLGRADEADT
ncbi:carboxypeptidase-like regulatory domain-containing protein [Streptomyces sp. RB6PN25]|uniref:Carboxypeptidase-like regulatory domain-containing protein n=1 Tax=Streptomyces humicola TaxID=2953240 RepID=A0ABT1Q2D1_9ACTN|nr:carboxypeptidase-like regulatory domain-containing protein [Streptomyces humicola]MCQ4084088.1 carboxypeptidase-like regulatory domain-containing protein [Streptomyces humicola]